MYSTFQFGTHDYIWDLAVAYRSCITSEISYLEIRGLAGDCSSEMGDNWSLERAVVEYLCRKEGGVSGYQV